VYVESNIELDFTRAHDEKGYETLLSGRPGATPTTRNTLTAKEETAMQNDRDAILDVIARMGLLADRRDWKALRELFADRIVADYSAMTKTPPVEQPADEVVQGWRFLAGFQATHHLIGLPSITIEGDHATAMAHFTATHVIPNTPGGDTWTLAGTYDYTLTRTPTGWRIQTVKMTPDWETGNKDLPKLAAERANAHP
jgi:ketosteroid isomerase-like protein